LPAAQFDDHGAVRNLPGNGRSGGLEDADLIVGQVVLAKVRNLVRLVQKIKGRRAEVNMRTLSKS